MGNSQVGTSPASISRFGFYFCLIGLLAIFFSIILRTEPTIMQNDILRIFHTPISTLSDLIIRYQYSLIATLLFAGVIVDFFGPRTILALALGAAIAGNYVFSQATTIPMMIDSRMLIGYAHPFILISALKLGTQWLPRRYFAFFCGLLFATLLMTPVIMKNTLISIVNNIGMHSTLGMINCFGIVLLWILLIHYRHESPINTPNKFSLKQILTPLFSGKIWLICIISLLGWIGNTFLLNYGALYLIGVRHFTHPIAIDTVNMAFACFAFGAIIMSLIAGFIDKKHLLITVGYLIAATALTIALYAPGLSFSTPGLLIFVASFFAGTAVISYEKAYDFCSEANAGSVFALIAFITTLGNSLFSLVFGNALQPTLTHLATTGAQTWQYLLGIIPLALAIGGISALMLHKKTTTHPRGYWQFYYAG